MQGHQITKTKGASRTSSRRYVSSPFCLKRVFIPHAFLPGALRCCVSLLHFAAVFRVGEMVSFQPGLLAFLERFRAAQVERGTKKKNPATSTKPCTCVKHLPPTLMKVAKALTRRQLQAMKVEVAADFAAKRCAGVGRNHGGSYMQEDVHKANPMVEDGEAGEKAEVASVLTIHVRPEDLTDLDRLLMSMP